MHNRYCEIIGFDVCTCSYWEARILEEDAASGVSHTSRKQAITAAKARRTGESVYTSFEEHTCNRGSWKPEVWIRRAIAAFTPIERKYLIEVIKEYDQD